MLSTGCSCGASHTLDAGADVARDAGPGTDGGADAARPDAARPDAAGPACIVDESIPMAPGGCCEFDRQRCTADCGSFVIHCDEGCCHFTGP